MALDQKRLHQVLGYEPATGAFTWKEPTSHRVKRGGRAGCVSSTTGHAQIRIDGVIHRAHRLAWLYVHGEWPKNQIDHINGVKTDNRVANLRDVDNQTNGENLRRPKKNNKVGILGVSPGRRGSFKAQIQVSGKNRYIGEFRTPQEAGDAYLSAKRALHAGGTL